MKKQEKVLVVLMETTEVAKLNNAVDDQTLVDKLSKKSNIVYALTIDTNLKAVAHSDKSRVGITLTDAGKGFAVVADEVRKLAEESMRSSSNIKDLIISTQQKTDKALLAIEEGDRESEKGQSIVKAVGDSLNQILKSFDETRTNLQRVNEMIINSKDNIDRMDGNINEIQAITTNTAANTEEVAASTEEQTAVLQQVTESVQQLTEMAVKLEDSIKTFKL